MSKISIEGNASGTGTLTIAAPNTNSNYTLTLPTDTGTVLTDSGNQTADFSALTVNSNNISADNSLGFRNRIINGDMRIDQRNAGASVSMTASSPYILDRWRFWANGSGGSAAYTVQQSSTAPAGFTNSCVITQTASYSPTGTNYNIFAQYIEGANVSDLGWGTANAKTVTLSFWVRSSLTGTFGGVISNAAQDRSYPFTYSISAANTWEYKTITIPGDTSGTWLITSGIGLEVYWQLGVGSTYLGTAGSWAGATYLGATGATQITETNGATLYITGVQLEVGSVATPFERRPYGTELALCQRYYYRIEAGIAGQVFGSGFNASTTGAFVIVPFPVKMRDAPSALEQSGTAGDYRVNRLTSATACSAVPSFEAGTSSYVGYVEYTVASGLTAGQGIAGSCTNTSAFLAWSAEL